MFNQAFFSSIGLCLCLNMFLLQVNAREDNTHKGVSGYYGNSMTIGVDEKNKTITGYYENHTGWDEVTQSPRFSCIFYFSGMLKANNYQIRSWHPDDQNVIEGNLTFLVEDEQKVFNLKLKDEHGGCGNVQHFAGENGADFQLEKEADWIAIEIVSAEKAFFHNSPDINTKGKSYVIKGDIVRILTIGKEWVRAEFGTDTITRGWIKRSDLDRVFSLTN